MKRDPAKTRTFRCAVYCRKSTEEGLQQEFNSLDAQRAACEAYIASQKSNGWRCVPAQYNDGGFSGGNLQRPALKQLLADIEAGQIDVVVVYKIDRLSRSLVDFVQLAAQLEKNGVSFVSVTQAFDTSTSTGRLMLNVLLSFGQFEREIIGERIRDKIAASRQRGRWTGGVPILGFDVDRSGASPKLVVNPAEASRTLRIFELYVELGSLLRVVAELDRLGWRCKSWTTRDGRLRGGHLFDKTRLHALLTNPIVIGKIRHKGTTYDGLHDAIVPQTLFDRVQTQLATNARRQGEFRNKHDALLRGLLFCASCNCAMVHTFSGRGAKRYRYYTCTHAMKRGRASCPTRSAPAAELERIVLEELRGIGRDPALIQATRAALRERRDEQIATLATQRSLLEQELAGVDVTDPQHDAIAARLRELERNRAELDAVSLDTLPVAIALADFDRWWAALSTRERVRLLQLVIQRVEFNGSSVKIDFADAGLAALAAPHAEDAA